MTEVWRVQLRPQSDKMVLLALADAANDDGVTWLAVQSRRSGKLDLMRKCSLSERAVQGAIKRLVAAGYLQRMEKPGKGVIYVVRHTPAESAGVKPEQSMITPADFAGPPADSAGKPLYKHNIKKSGNCGDPVDKCSITDRILPEGLPCETWDQYLIMRVEAQKPVTAGACHILLGRLEQIAKAGHDIKKLVETGTASGWMFFNEPKKRKAKGKYD